MILAIVGPTGVGKTKCSVELAKKYNAIVVNCDATQIYRGLDIGSAKVTEEEKEGVVHLLFDIKDVTEDYTVFDYQKDAREILEKYKDRNIIFVGGTGLYLKAALYDYRFSLENGKKDDFDNYTNEELMELVKKKDPSTKIHVNNRVRLIRFLNKEDINVVPPIPLYDFKIIGLTTDRAYLYERINNRVDEMISNGLEDEVRRFYDKGIISKPLLTGIGYKEFYDYFNGKISKDEAIDLIKKNSRHYAKRQYTFFNHQLPVEWFEVNFDCFSETINNVIDYIEGDLND